MISVSCSGCGHVYQVPDASAGKSATCGKSGCGYKFIVPVPGPIALTFDPEDEDDLMKFVTADLARKQPLTPPPAAPPIPAIPQAPTASSGSSTMMVLAVLSFGLLAGLMLAEDPVTYMAMEEWGWGSLATTVEAIGLRSRPLFVPLMVLSAGFFVWGLARWFTARPKIDSDLSQLR